MDVRIKEAIARGHKKRAENRELERRRQTAILDTIRHDVESALIVCAEIAVENGGCLLPVCLVAKEAAVGLERSRLDAILLIAQQMGLDVKDDDIILP